MTQPWEYFCAARKLPIDPLATRRAVVVQYGCLVLRLSLTLGALCPALPANAASLEEVVRAATTGYPSIEVARANTEAARFQLDQAKAQHFPTEIGRAHV